MKPELFEKRYKEYKNEYLEIGKILQEAIKKSRKLHRKVMRTLDNLDYDHNTYDYKFTPKRKKMEEFTYVNDYIKDALDCIRTGCKKSEY